MASCCKNFLRNISVVLIYFLIFGTKSFAQHNPDGFISIDCGSDAPSADPQTNLLWVEDGDYVRTGTNGLIHDSKLVNSTLDNYHALRNFRYFSDKEMSKYCYELPMTTSNVSFLLRAMFLHGNASELSLPTVFDVYVNGTGWLTVNYTESDNLWEPVVQESIYFSPPGGNTTNVCLLPIEGLPFISSLELRQLDPDGIMYSKSFVDRTKQELSFNNILRYNFGTYNMSTVRYPDDPYDRLWYSFANWASLGDYTGYDYVTKFEYITSQETWSSIGPEINSVPSKVMEDAWTFQGVNDLDVDLPNTEPGTLAYAIFYFALLNESTKDNPISLSLSLDTTTYTTFNISSQPSQQSFFLVMNANFAGVNFNNSGVLNAWEFYQQYSFFEPTTSELDHWQGDPCTPRPYNWLDCILDYTGSKFDVLTLNLSHLQNSKRLIEESNISYWQLDTVSITESNLDSNLFQSLLQNFLNTTYFETLDVSFNDIDTFPDAQWWIKVANGSDYWLNYLDFSHNQLSQIPQFVDIPFSYQMEYLNISNNNITGEFPSIAHFSNLSTLQVLDISNNFIQGQIPLSLSCQNLPSLQWLDISNNGFSGEFPSFMGDCHFQWLNVDNNEISGVLNLTTWYQNTTGFNQTFSFLNNKISSIEPSAEDFRPVIESLKNREVLMQGGILLGGNPYCNHAKKFTQRYFCRSSLTDIINEDVKEKSPKGIILGSVLGGGFLLLCFVFFMLAIWRLSKKVSTLKMVEQELASRRVQPPYFSYYDLKVATNNFHKDNQLGKGSFGAVYKGVLSDGTTIAVKRLFNSHEKQVLNEFLNEVVLITGIKHRNLIQLKGCCIENEQRILVYEYAENGNVEDALWGQDGETILSWTSRFKICIGIASGLTYLHEELQPRIIHRDIKPGNVLLDKNLNPKIADFGLAKHFVEEIDVHLTEVISGTRGYFAPEYLAEGRLTTKIDVFSFGILALEIVSGRKCFDQRLPPEEIQLKSWAENLQRSGSTLKLLDPVIQMDYSAPEVLKVIKIALMCVQNDPELRPTMSQVEIMFLEGQDIMYQVLSSAAAFRKGENKSSLDKIYKNFGDGMGVDTISTLFSGHGSQASGVGSSSTNLEHYPLLHSPHKESGSETSEGSSGTRKEYFRALRAMNRSLSERIKRGSSEYM